MSYDCCSNTYTYGLSIRSSVCPSVRGYFRLHFVFATRAKPGTCLKLLLKWVHGFTIAKIYKWVDITTSRQMCKINFNRIVTDHSDWGTAQYLLNLCFVGFCLSVHLYSFDHWLVFLVWVCVFFLSEFVINIIHIFICILLYKCGKVTSNIHI